MPDIRGQPGGRSTGGAFDLVHHVLPFALAKTYNLAALRHANRTPFLMGPVQPTLAMPDLDVNAKDPTSLAATPQAGIGWLIPRIRALASTRIAPHGLSWLSRKTLISAAL